MGVPVITAGDEVIVGFDRSRLEQIAARHAGRATSGSKLGLLVRNAPGGGVEIGGARVGSPAQQAGALAGDQLESINGQPIRSVSDLERLAGNLQDGERVELTVRRQGRNVRLVLTT